MTGLVERLRALFRDLTSGYRDSPEGGLLAEAADEIERLTALYATLDALCGQRKDDLGKALVMLDKAAAEIERLRQNEHAEIHRLNADIIKRARKAIEAADEIERLRAENEQLKIALSDSPRDDGTHVHRLDEREGDQ